MARDLFEKQRESLRDVYAAAIYNLEGVFGQLKGAEWELAEAKRNLRRARSVMYQLEQFCEAMSMTIHYGEPFAYWTTSRQNISELKATLAAKRLAYKNAKDEHKKASNYVNAVQILLGIDKKNY